MLHLLEQLDRALVAPASCEMSKWRRSVSVICVPIVSVGFSDVIGSWKIIAISRPRTSSSSRSESFVRSRPSKHDRAGDDLRRRLRDQAHDRERGHRLAAAGLADDPERLPLLDRRRRRRRPRAPRPRGCRSSVRRSSTSSSAIVSYVSFVRGSSASRRPSAMKLAQRTSQRDAPRRESR